MRMRTSTATFQSRCRFSDRNLHRLYERWRIAKTRRETPSTLLRRVLPKGSSFDGLTQDDVNLACSHMSSCPREVLGWRSPFETLPGWGQENLPQAFGMRIIPRDEVNLTPSLIGR